MKSFKLILLSTFLIILGCADRETEPLQKLDFSSFDIVSLNNSFDITEYQDKFLSSIGIGKYDNFGNIVISDFRTKDLILFSHDGNFKQVISSEGRGPGEFIILSDFHLVDSTLTIMDKFGMKKEVFIYNNGLYNHEITISLPRTAILDRALLTEKDRIISLTSNAFGMQDTSTFNAIRVLSTDLTNIIDTLFTIPRREVVRDANGDMRTFSNELNLISRISDYKNGYAYFNWSDSLIVYKYDLEGNKKLAFSYDVELLPYSVEERDRLIDSFGNDMRNAVRNQIREHYPLVKSMFVDDFDRIWFEFNSDLYADKWIVFSTSGQALFVMNKPDESATILDIANDNIMLWKGNNADGEPSLNKASFQMTN